MELPIADATLEDPAPAPQASPDNEGTAAPLTFTPEQEIALFGGPASPGAEYTITVRAGDSSDPSGSLTFEVVSEPSGAPGAGEPGDLEETEEDDDPAVSKALGYDRKALNKGRKNMDTPPMGADFLMED